MKSYVTQNKINSVALMWAKGTSASYFFSKPKKTIHHGDLNHWIL